MRARGTLDLRKLSREDFIRNWAIKYFVQERRLLNSGPQPSSTPSTNVISPSKF